MTLTLFYPFDPDLFPTITQNYSEHQRTAKINGWSNYNAGIDWALPSGTIIRAAHSGTVIGVSNDATGYGMHIRIKSTNDDEADFITIYAHLQRTEVRKGDKVMAGEPIGLSDSTGFSTGPHLHFELRKNNKPVDPSPYIVATEPLTNMLAVEINYEPGQSIRLKPTYNMRSGPGLNYLQYCLTLNHIPAMIQEINGDWVKIAMTAYVHRAGIKSL